MKNLIFIFRTSGTFIYPSDFSFFIGFPILFYLHPYFLQETIDKYNNFLDFNSDIC